jgi:predicted RNase H-related nuclease YkuK (DUF458 family)
MLLTCREDMKFENTVYSNMEFEEVFENIKNFILKNPMGKYKLMIGTDSQVRSDGTLFVSGIVIHREGDGAWACRKHFLEGRRLYNLHEKISYETSLSEEIAYLFTYEKILELEDLILPHIYKGSSFEKEAHLDIGDKPANKTNLYVNEMLSRVESMGFKAVIKPHSLVASGYANKFTKYGKRIYI